MKLTFLKEECLFTLKSNLADLFNNFCLPTNEWIFDYFGYTPFVETKYEIENFSLDMSQSKPSLTDFENVQRIYNRLRFLSDSQASDERLWTGLCINHFWRYTQYRWSIIDKCSIDSVKQHFFFSYAARRSLTRNAISRLWWIGRLTYDPMRKDPYELTKFICNNSRNINDILEKNFSNNHKILKPFIEALLAAKNEGCCINSETVRSLSKYINLLGGIYILDCLSEEEIYNKTIVEARKIKVH